MSDRMLDSRESYDDRRQRDDDVDVILLRMEQANGGSLARPFSLAQAARDAQAACAPPAAPCGFGGCPRCDR